MNTPTHELATQTQNIHKSFTEAVEHNGVTSPHAPIAAVLLDELQMYTDQYIDAQRALPISERAPKSHHPKLPIEVMLQALIISDDTKNTENVLPLVDTIYDKIKTYETALLAHNASGQYVVDAYNQSPTLVDQIQQSYDQKHGEYNYLQKIAHATGLQIAAGVNVDTNTKTLLELQKNGHKMENSDYKNIVKTLIAAGNISKALELHQARPDYIGQAYNADPTLQMALYIASPTNEQMPLEVGRFIEQAVRETVATHRYMLAHPDRLTQQAINYLNALRYSNRDVSVLEGIKIKSQLLNTIIHSEHYKSAVALLQGEESAGPKLPKYVNDAKGILDDQLRNMPYKEARRTYPERNAQTLLLETMQNYGVLQQNEPHHHMLQKYAAWQFDVAAELTAQRAPLVFESPQATDTVQKVHDIQRMIQEEMPKLEYGQHIIRNKIEGVIYEADNILSAVSRVRIFDAIAEIVEIETIYTDRLAEEVTSAQERAKNIVGTPFMQKILKVTKQL